MRGSGPCCEHGGQRVSIHASPADATTDGVDARYDEWVAQYRAQAHAHALKKKRAAEARSRRRLAASTVVCFCLCVICAAISVAIQGEVRE